MTSIEKSKESELIYSNLLETIDVGFYQVTLDGQMLNHNRAHNTILGYDPLRSLKSFDVRRFWQNPEDRDKYIEYLLNFGFTKNYICHALKKDGTKIVVELNSYLIRDEEGNPIRIDGTFIDITEKYNLQRKLEESEKKYREAYNRAHFYRDLFAHDINNILHIIGSSIELIAYHQDDSKNSKILEEIRNIINKQVDRGAKLVSNVHTLSKLEEEEIHAHPTEICELMEKAIDFVKKSYNSRNIQIKIDCPEDHVIINANEQIQDVFENILHNSVKYNDNSDIIITIKISKTKIDGNVYNRIEFIDNGIGVSDDRKRTIFKQGNREFKGTKGMGLGLSLVKKILKTFKGRIWVEDKIKGDFSQGSKFIVLLP
ncbi:MAG: ATP-binding protein [Promethearchaeota archaeon]